VIQAWQDLGEDAGRVQNQFGPTTRQINLALGYYREFPDEIDNALVLTRRSSEEVEAAYPFIEILRIED